MKRRVCFVLAVLGLLLAAAPAGAWDRGHVETFAVLPAFAPNGGTCPGGASVCSSDIEGVAVGPDGAIYTPSFGFNKDGPLSGNGELFVISPSGHVITHFPVLGSSPHLIGAIFQTTTNTVLIADLGLGAVWQVNPFARTSKMFMQAPTIAGGPGLNAIAVDKKGNVYVSDSFQGAIWMIGAGGGNPTKPWLQNNLLLPTPGSGEALNPPFGANGIAFNNEGTILYVNNTAYHSIIAVPVNGDGSAGTPTTLTTGINAPDGIAIDRADDLWVLANQEDEVVVIDPTGKVIAKKGDFKGIASDGSIRGLLFPASNAFSPDGRFMYITNLALYLPYAGAPSIGIDSGWTLQVERYNLARIEVSPCSQPCCISAQVCCTTAIACCNPHGGHC